MTGSKKTGKTALVFRKSPLKKSNGGHEFMSVREKLLNTDRRGETVVDIEEQDSSPYNSPLPLKTGQWESLSRKSTGADDKFQLKQEIGLATAIALIGGSLIGSGIFMTPGGILSDVESVGASLCIWAFSGVYALCCALCYLEWGLLIRESGGEYAVAIRAYGDWFGFLTAWAGTLISKPGSMLLITYTFSEYMIALVYPAPCYPTDGLKKLVTACCIIIVMFINITSVKLSSIFQQTFWYAKVLALLIVIAMGMIQLAEGNTKNFENAFEGSSTNPLAYANALYGGLWGYDGWNQLNFVTEEIKDPARNFPIAVWVAIPMVAVIYILTNISYLTVLSPHEVMNSKAVAVTYAYKVLGSWAWIVPVGVVCSTFGTANGSMFTAGRISFVASRRGHLPKVLSYIDTIRYTPSLAILLNTFIALLFLIPDSSSFSVILDLFQFTTWIFYGTSCFAVVILRYKEPFASMPRSFKLPIIIPVLVFLVSLYLIVAPVINEPDFGYLYVMIIVLSGLIFYIPIHVFKIKTFDKPMAAITLYLQNVLQLAPGDVEFSK